MTILTLRRPLGTAVVRDVEKTAGADRLGSARRTIARWLARSRQRRALRDIADDFHLLKDIGVSQDEAFREANKPFWRP
jgi:uncharacterized protein YjiS (DUF1127 family)